MGRYTVIRHKGPNTGKWNADEATFMQWAEDNKIGPMDEIYDSETGQAEYAKHMAWTVLKNTL
jgi:hypothetical protein